MTTAHEKCPECGEFSVHLAIAPVLFFYGDVNDANGNESKYGVEILLEDESVALFAHICFECGYLDDVGIEHPREKAVNTSTSPKYKKASKKRMSTVTQTTKAPNVKITTPDSKHQGKLGRITFTYYDHKHTGSSPDLHIIQMETGETIQLLSTQVEAYPTVELWPNDGDWTEGRDAQITKFFTNLLAPHHDLEALDIGDTGWDEFSVSHILTNDDYAPTGKLRIGRNNGAGYNWWWDYEEYDVSENLAEVLMMLDFDATGYLAGRKRTTAQPAA